MRAWTRIVTLVLIAGAVVAVAWVLSAPSTTRTPIGGAVPDEHGLRVSLTFSSCEALDRIDVAEDSRQVRLTAYLRGRGSCGQDPMTTQTVPVPLKTPLRDREVVDGATGRRLTL
ncbi:hypothetical protein GCM10009827_113720 [Dactylosporangium maewongense]|uniref:Uncharacterized protein n=1 Tax=Dactylosporangium maewongense TaxID=634393 RepID=A0ABP4P5M7_9ACTN